MGTLISRQGDMKKPLIKLGMDLLFFIILVLPVAIFNLTKAVQPNIRGFFCSDNSIRYPFRSSTVPSVVLFVIGIPVVVAMTFMIEFAYYRLYSPTKRGFFHPLIVALYRVFGFFIVGATINQILTDVVKLSVGRLRPMFYDVCKPSIECNSTMEQHTYVLNYTCTRTEYVGYSDSDLEEMMTDIRKSFPSGHSSFAMYCSVFAVIYLELRLKYRPTRMFKICLQALALSSAIWTCCTRYMDNKHHATDIVFGAIFGITIGTFAVALYYRSLTYPRRKRTCQSTANGSPASVGNKSVTQVLQVEVESNGILDDPEAATKVEGSSPL